MLSEPAPVVWILHSDPVQREARATAARQGGLISVPLESAKQGLVWLNEGSGLIPDLILFDDGVHDVSPGEFLSALIETLGDQAPPVIFTMGSTENAELLTSPPLRTGKDVVLCGPQRARDVVRTMLSVAPRPEDVSRLVHVSGLELDVARRTLAYKDRYINLTQLESSFMEYLMRRRVRLVRNDELLEHVWGFVPGTGGHEVVRSHVSNLRRKLQSLGAPRDLIWNIPRRGYGLREAPGHQPPVVGFPLSPSKAPEE